MARSRLAVALVAALAVVLLAGCTSRAGGPGPTPASTSRSTTPTTGTAPAGDSLAAVYAAALRSFVGRPRAGLYLHDFICPDVTREPASPDCGRRPIPPSVSAALSGLLSGWAAVHLVAWDDPVPNGATVATLGPTRRRGPAVEQQVSYVCGGLCGEGATVVLAASGAGWRVTGQTEPGWIS